MDSDPTEATPLPSASEASTSSSEPSSSSSSYTARVSRTCVHPPTIIRIRDPDSSAPSSLFQFSLHTAPLTLKRELHTVLPSLNPSDSLLVLPTFQQSLTPLTTFTPQTESEKNRLLEAFSGFARSLCLYLTSRGYFADYIDPCTGHPALTRSGGAVYSEVDGASALLRYRVEQAGFCSIVLHPLWGSGCYPASCVTNARLEAVLEGLDRVRRRWEVNEEHKDDDEESEEKMERTAMTSDDQQSDTSRGGVEHNAAGSDSDGRSKQQSQQQQAAMGVYSVMATEQEKELGVVDDDTRRKLIAVSSAVMDALVGVGVSMLHQLLRLVPTHELIVRSSSALTSHASEL